jgi:hypothetical protein
LEDAFWISSHSLFSFDFKRKREAVPFIAHVESCCLDILASLLIKAGVFFACKEKAEVTVVISHASTAVRYRRILASLRRKLSWFRRLAIVVIAYSHEVPNGLLVEIFLEIAVSVESGVLSKSVYHSFGVHPFSKWSIMRPPLFGQLPVFLTLYSFI